MWTYSNKKSHGSHFARFGAAALLINFSLALASCSQSSTRSTNTNQNSACTDSKARIASTAQLMLVGNSSPLNSQSSTQNPTMTAQVNASTNTVSHIPNAVNYSLPMGSVEPDLQIEIAIALTLNHEAELDTVVHDLYDPSSPTYHQFFKTGEFQAYFQPDISQVQEITTFLATQNIQPVDDDGFVIRATGKASDIQKLFSTQLQYYIHPNGTFYFAPSTNLIIPPGLGIKSIQGMNNLTLSRPHLRTSAQGVFGDSAQLSRSLNETATSNSGLLTYKGYNYGYLPNDIKTAYNIPANINGASSPLNGAGQTVALFELDGFNASDIATYQKCYYCSAASLSPPSSPSPPNVSVTTIPVGMSSALSPGCSADEVSLDIELMIALLPNASNILVYEGINSSAGIQATYRQIANDNRASVISTSWGSAEDEMAASDIQQEHIIFSQMVAQGQTLFAASGDSGSYDDGATLSVDDPSSQPNVVGVGGTTLITNADGTYNRETTWLSAGQGIGGGGGISSIWSVPTFQSGVINNSQSSTTFRNTPDVALNADPNTGYAIYSLGQCKIEGGTSAAAPLWAAFTALVNQQRAYNGVTQLGSTSSPGTPTLNAFYQAATPTSSSTYQSIYHDVADNSTNGYYKAVTGYDNATGLGTFNGANFINELSKSSY